MPAPDVPQQKDTIGIRYEGADGVVHIWTCGPGMANFTLHKLRSDAGNPRSVNIVRWGDTAWEIVPDNWMYGLDPLQSRLDDNMMAIMEYTREEWEAEEEYIPGNERWAAILAAERDRLWAIDRPSPETTGIPRRAARPTEDGVAL